MLQRFRQYLRSRGLRLRSLLYPLVLILVMFAVYKYRQSNQPEKHRFRGQTMGTTYQVQYLGNKETGLQKSVDSLLKRFNQSLSTYIDHSEISKFNRDGREVMTTQFFYPVLAASKKIFKNTNGAFDPTVGPLVDAWGFGKKKSEVPDSAVVDSLRQLVSFNHIRFDKDKVEATRPGVQLDFSALAKGYGVDVVGDLLRNRGIQHFMVEIGGEVVCRGHNARNNPWLIGITNPVVKEQDQQRALAKVRLKNRAMATSGNYYNYYIKDGKKYVHTIDPRTGYPVQHNLLSATVFADSCMRADGYATAFMVLGTDSAKKVIREQKNLFGYLIYRDDSTGNIKTWYSPDFGRWIKE